MNILINYAMSFVGTPYLWGGKYAPTGLDCSGLVSEILSSVGLCPPGENNAQMLFDHFSKNGAWNHLQAGSLCFYGSSVTNIIHVAFMIDPYRVIEAGGGGSAVVDLKSAEMRHAMVRIRPYKNHGGLVAVIRPDYSSIGLR